ncbi:ABC transporter substrate-binding protein [Clostridium beijerinckii]|nr:ABC transporter substrate-binding protein [Clostridium beijerinckii]
MRKRNKKIILMLIYLFSLTFLSGCNKKEIKNEDVKVTLRLQWQVQAQFAGYFVAKEKGVYKDEGLDVDIQEGGYGKDCVTTVKRGAEEFVISKGSSY